MHILYGSVDVVQAVGPAAQLQQVLQAAPWINPSVQQAFGRQQMQACMLYTGVFVPLHTIYGESVESQ